MTSRDVRADAVAAGRMTPASDTEAVQVSSLSMRDDVLNATVAVTSGGSDCNRFFRPDAGSWLMAEFAWYPRASSLARTNCPVADLLDPDELMVFSFRPVFCCPRFFWFVRHF